MKHLTRKLVLMLLPLCFLLLLVLPVFATGVSPISDIMTVYDPAGNIFVQRTVTEAEEVIVDGFPIFFYLEGVAVNNLLLDRPTWLYEPGGNGTDGPWSDVIAIVTVPGDDGGSALAFASDIENVAFPSPPALSIPIISEEQPGVPLNITYYLSNELQDAGYTATFVSDANVPEPSTYLLLGAGLAGVGLLRRKLRNS